jgi:hypothetical protein
MRGDQLALRWRIIRANKASRDGLTGTWIARREETGLCTNYHDPEALQAAGFTLYVERVDKADLWALIETLKFKFLPSFSLTKFRPLVLTVFPTEGLKDIPSYDSLDSTRALRG